MEKNDIRRAWAFQSTFWTSPTFKDYSAKDKYLLFYLLSNPHSNFCGCYQIHPAQIAEETGLARDDILTGLQRLAEGNAICFSEMTNELLIGDGLRQSFISSPRMEKRLRKEIGRIRHPVFRIFVRAEFLRLKDNDAQEKYRALNMYIPK